MKRTALDIKNLPKEKSTRALAKVVHHALEDMKAANILYINVKDISSVTDVMVIASGTSTRHVKSVSDAVVESCKKQGFKVIGVEGQDSCEWILVDLGDILVHIMQENTRKFYELEKLWDHKEIKGEINLGIKNQNTNEIENQIKQKIDNEIKQKIKRKAIKNEKTNKKTGEKKTAAGKAATGRTKSIASKEKAKISKKETKKPHDVSKPKKKPVRKNKIE